MAIAVKPSSAHAATSVFYVPPGPGTYNWNDATHWSSGGIPNAASGTAKFIQFGNGGTVAFEAANDLGTVNLQGLIFGNNGGAAMVISGNTLNFNAGTNPSITMSTTSLVTINAAITENNGTMIIDNTLNTASSLTIGEFDLPVGGLQLTSTGTGANNLTISGNIFLSGTSGANRFIQNNGGGVVRIGNDSSTVVQVTGANPNTLTLSGSSNFVLNSVLKDSDTAGGLLSFKVDSNFAGNLAVNSAALMTGTAILTTAAAGSITLNVADAFANANTVSIAGNLQVNANESFKTLSLSGTTTVTSGLSSGSVTISAQTLYVGGTLTTTAAVTVPINLNVSGNTYITGASRTLTSNIASTILLGTNGSNLIQNADSGAARTLTITNATAVINGVLSDFTPNAAGTLSFFFNAGGGNLTVNSTGQMSGTVTLTNSGVSSGYYALNAANAFGSDPTATINGALLLGAGANQTFKQLTVAGNALVMSMSSNTVTIDGTGLTLTVSTGIRNLTLSNGILALTGASSKFNAGGASQTGGNVTLSGAILKLDNSAAALSGRLNATVSFNMSNGILQTVANASTAVSDTFGTMNLVSGQSTISFTGAASSKATTLVGTSLTRSAGAVLLVSLDSSGTIAGGSATGGRNLFFSGGVPTAPGGFLNGTMIVQTPTATDLATYRSTAGVTTPTYQTVGANFTPLAGGGVWLNNGTTSVVSGTQSLAGLKLVNGTMNDSTGTLSFNNTAVSGAVGGILATGGGASRINSPIAWTGANDLIMYVDTGSSLSISNLVDSAGQTSFAGQLVKAGGGTLFMTANANSYSGGMVINAGTVSILGSNGYLGNVPATGPNVTFNGTGALIMRSTGSNLDVDSTRTFVINNGVTATLGVTDPSFTMTINGVVSGNGVLSKVGNGTLDLDNGSNSYIGGTIINAGTLGIRAGGSMGDNSNVTTFAANSAIRFTQNTTTAIGASRTFYITDGVTATFDSTTRNVSISSLITGGANGTLAVNGAGTLYFNNVNNSYLGGTIINAGALSVSFDGALGSASGNLSLSGGTLSLQGTGFTSNRSVTAVAATSSTINVTSGGAATFTGPLAVNGTLTATGSGTLRLGSVSVASGGTLQVGSVSGGVLTISSGLTLASGSVLGMTFGSSTINLNSSLLTLSAGTETISLAGTVSSTGDFLLIGNASSIASTGATLNLNSTNLVGAGYSYSLVSNSSQILLHITSGFTPTGILTWTGATNNSWEIGGPTNWLDGVTPASYADGNTVTFADTNAGTIAITTSGVLPASVTVTNSGANKYTFTGGPIGGATGLTKNGNGALVIANVNTFTGATNIVAGSVSLTGAIASTAITVSGTLDVASGASLSGTNPTVTVAGMLTLSNSQSMVLKDAGAGGTVSLANSNTLTLNSGSSFGGAIGGTGGIVTIAGDSTLSGVNTYSGATLVNTGAALSLLGTGQIKSSAIVITGSMNVAANTALSGNAGNPTVTVAGGVLTLSNSQNLVLKDNNTGGTVNLASTSSLFLGTGSSFGGAIGGTGQVGISGNTTLSGNNTYSGGTMVLNGNLSVLASGTLAPGSTLTVDAAFLGVTASFANVGQNLGGVTNNNLLSFTAVSGTTTISTLLGAGVTSFSSNAAIGSIAAGTVSVAGNLTSSAGISGGSVTVGGIATITAFSGASTALSLSGASGSIGTINGSGAIVLNGTALTVSGGSFGGAISGSSGSLVIAASTTLAGANNYTGGTTVSGGQLTVTSGSRLPTFGNLTIGVSGSAVFNNPNQSLGSVVNNGTLSFSNGGTVLMGDISGPGTTTITGNAIISNISGGSLYVTGSLNSPLNVLSGNVTVGGVATLNAVSGATTAISLSGATASIGSLAGAGAITLSGTQLTITGGSYSGSFNNGVSPGSLVVAANVLTYSGVNNLTGGITLTTNATLAVAAQSALGSNGLIFNGGTLHVTGNIDDTGKSFNFAGGGTLNIDSGVTLTITGSQITGNITQTGLGTLHIVGAYGGTTAVGAGGTYEANPGSTGNVTLASGATLDFTSPGQYSGDVTVATNSSATILNTSGGLVTLSGMIVKANANLTLAGSSAYRINGTITGGTTGLDFNSDMTFNANTTLATQQSYVGPTTISSNAVVTAGVNNALPSTTILNLGETAGNTTGSYDLAGFTQTLAGIVAWGSGTNNSITSSTGNASLYVNIASGVDSYSGKLGGSLSLFKEGSGTLALTGTSNNYTGATTVDAGTLQLGVNAALPSTTTLSVAGGAVFDMNGHTQTVADLVSTSSAAIVTGASGSVLTVSHSSATQSVYAGTISGAVSLAFNGVSGSSEVLSGVSNYSGSTTINSGALLVNGSITGAGSAVTVNSGATLGGEGSIARDVVVNTSGTLAPGMGAGDAGPMSVGGNLTVAGTYVWDLTTLGTPSASPQTGGGVNFDQITLSGGTLNLTGGQLQLNFSGAATPNASASFWQQSEKWAIVTGAGGLTGLLNLNAPSYGFGSFSLEASLSGGALMLDWTPVPEPGTLLLGAMAASALGFVARRRKRSAISTEPKA